MNNTHKRHLWPSSRGHHGLHLWCPLDEDYSLKINELNQSSQAGVILFELNSC